MLTLFMSYFICRTDSTVLASCGFHGDVLTLSKVLEARLKVRTRPVKVYFVFFLQINPDAGITMYQLLFLVFCSRQMYEHDNHKKMSCKAIASMLSSILYYRRFFPYYTYNVLAGLDDEGIGLMPGFGNRVSTFAIL